MPYETFSSVVDTIEPSDSVSTYAGRLKNRQLNRKVLGLERTFSTWVEGAYREFSLLLLARILLEFEINRINSYWYSDPVVFPFEATKPLLADLCGEQGALKDSAQEIYDYAVKLLHWEERAELRSVLRLKQPLLVSIMRRLLPVRGKQEGKSA